MVAYSFPVDDMALLIKSDVGNFVSSFFVPMIAIGSGGCIVVDNSGCSARAAHWAHM